MQIAPTQVTTLDNVQMNFYHCNKGEGLPMHSHSYSHITYCVSGSCLVTQDGKFRTITSNTKPLILKANFQHEIEALENGTAFVNAFTLETTGEKI